MPDNHTLEIYDWKRNKLSNETLARTAAQLPTFICAWYTTYTLELWATANDIPNNADAKIQHIAAELFALIHNDKEEF